MDNQDTDLSGFVLDFQHESHRPAVEDPNGRIRHQETRTTYCYIYDEATFQTWRKKQSEMRDLIDDNPSLMLDSKEVRLGRPAPIAVGWATCYTQLDNFSRKEGRKRAEAHARRELTLVVKERKKLVGREKALEKAKSIARSQIQQPAKIQQVQHVHVRLKNQGL